MWAGIWFVATTELESDLPAIVDWVRKWPIAVKKHILFFIRFCFPTLVLMMWKLIDLFLNFLKTFKKLGMLELPFSSILNWDSYINYIAKNNSKKSEPYSFCNVSFFWGCHLPLPNDMEYCFHFWASAPTCFLGIWDKLQKQVFRTLTCCISWADWTGSTSSF